MVILKVHICSTSGDPILFRGVKARRHEADMSLEEIVEFVKAKGQCVVDWYTGTRSTPESEPYLLLEVYDDYRE